MSKRMDGMHRIARALLEGRTTIRAVRLRELPMPDYRGAARTSCRTTAERAGQGEPIADSGVTARDWAAHWPSSIGHVLRCGGTIEGVDLGEFYERVEQLILDLRSSGRTVESEDVEEAIRGGSTSGEILSRLTSVLTDVAGRVPDRFDVGALAAWARKQSA